MLICANMQRKKQDLGCCRELIAAANHEIQVVVSKTDETVQKIRYLNVTAELFPSFGEPV